MKTLKLITTENFNNIKCDFYCDTNNNIFLTREQIGIALEYKNPRKAIEKIHLSHKDRLDDLCIRITEYRVPKNGGKGIPVETIYYTERGIMEICRWSRQKKSNQFMDWCWDIIEKYRNKTLNTNYFEKDFINAMNENYKVFSDIIQTMQNSITAMQIQTARTNELLIKLIENNTKEEKFKHNDFPEWISKMMQKFSIIKNYYFSEDKGYKNTYAKIFFEFNCTYGINILSDALEEFCYQNNCKKCSTMDMVAYTPEIRTNMESIINNMINKIIELKRNESNK